MNQKQRAEMIQTALGRAKADEVFTGGQLVNVYSGEIIPHIWVAFKGAHVAYVGPSHPELIGEKTRVHELEGRFLLPGFIDGHTHLDSIFQVKSYAEYALAYGNTTAVSEVAMIANAYGVKGVEFFLQETEDLPLRVFVLAPPLVPPFPELETSRAFPASFFRKLLANNRCLGVGETYWPKVVGLEERALGQYQLSDMMGKTREGHAAGARNAKLVAYAAAGTSSCHEATNLDEALDRLRLGMAVMIREGYVRRELEAISGIAKQPVDLHNVMLVTDLADPEELVYSGGMNLLLKKAVALGFEPVKAIQMVTINVARYFGLRDLGGLAPGKVADMVVVDDLEGFYCHQVWAAGRPVARDAKLTIEISQYAYPDEAGRSVALKKSSQSLFQIPAGESEAKIRVVEIVNDTITRETICQMKAVAGKWVADPEKDILKLAVFNKSISDVKPFLSFVKGVGIRKGAIASSLIWDTNNILVVGTSDREMSVAINQLISLGGGVVVVKEQEVTARLALPLCGIISPEPLPEIVREMGEVEKACRRLGSNLTRLLLTLQTLPFTGLPYLRPTDKGLADIRKGKLVPLSV
ncbi:MAG: adenine deaminase [Deltaproteobacteria bacterium]|nr:adenine deaminase [Deltaproteobacteria bacterium]